MHCLVTRGSSDWLHLKKCPSIYRRDKGSYSWKVHVTNPVLIMVLPTIAWVILWLIVFESSSFVRRGEFEVGSWRGGGGWTPQCFPVHQGFHPTLVLHSRMGGITKSSLQARNSVAQVCPRKTRKRLNHFVFFNEEVLLLHESRFFIFIFLKHLHRIYDNRGGFQREGM